MILLANNYACARATINYIPYLLSRNCPLMSAVTSSVASDSASATDSAQQKAGAVKEHLGIPKATFVEDVPAYIRQETVEKQRTVEQLARSIEEQHGRYKMMEASLLNRRARLKQQIPELRSNLDAIRTVRDKQQRAASGEQADAMKCTYLLADGVYARANVSTKPESRVYLWLGANTMLEYTVDEADNFLRRQLEAAETQLAQLDSDVAFLKDQITICEVNSSRVQIAVSKQRALSSASGASRTLQSVKEDDAGSKKSEVD